MKKSDIEKLKKEVDELYKLLSIPSQPEQNNSRMHSLHTELQYIVPTVYQSSESKLDSKV